MKRCVVVEDCIVFTGTYEECIEYCVKGGLVIESLTMGYEFLHDVAIV